MQALEDVVTFHLEVLLEGYFGDGDVRRLHEINSCELQGVIGASVEEGPGLGEGGDKVFGT